MRVKLCILVVLAGVVLLNGCAGNNSDSNKKTESASEKEESSGDGVLSGKSNTLPLPITFEASDTKENEVSSGIFLETKLTMINVWATYCNPCLEEMTDLGELSREYDSGEFQIIGVISDVPEGTDQDSLEKVSGLIEQTGADYPHLLINQSIYKAMLADVTVVPTTFFFDEHGMLLDTLVGARDKDGWKEIIDALLEKQ